jgi:hypothetical protein
MEELVFVFLQCATVSSLLLAWYWISAQDEIRTATDAMFLGKLLVVTNNWLTRAATSYKQ